jgi:hypothetical protein
MCLDFEQTGATKSKNEAKSSLKFIPVEEMEKAGYCQYLPPFVKAGLIKASTTSTNAPAKN